MILNIGIKMYNGRLALFKCKAAEIREGATYYKERKKYIQMKKQRHLILKYRNAVFICFLDYVKVLLSGFTILNV